MEKIRNGDSIWLVHDPMNVHGFIFYIGDKKVQKQEWISQISQNGEDVASLVQSARKLRTRCLVVGYTGLGILMVGVVPLIEHHTNYQNIGAGPVVPAIILGATGMAGAIIARGYANQSANQYREAVLIFNERLRSQQSGVHLGLGFTQHGLGLVLSW